MMLVTKVVAALVAAGLVGGVTPDGFEPQAQGDLIVAYGDVEGSNGVSLQKNSKCTTRKG